MTMLQERDSETAGPPLIEGGQGRSAEDVEADGDRLGTAMAIIILASIVALAAVGIYGWARACWEIVR